MWNLKWYKIPLKWVPTAQTDLRQEMVVTKDKMRWAVNKLMPYKWPGPDGIYSYIYKRDLS